MGYNSWGGYVADAPSVVSNPTSAYSGYAAQYSAPTPTPTPTPTPAANPGTTGDANLDALLARLDQMIQDQAAAGKKFNPNIELTPEVVKQFLDQATAEIEPYYAGQINAVKDQLVSNLTSLQKNYDLQKQTQEATFKQNLNSTRENLAANGAAYSGFRGQQEQQLTQGTNRTLEGLGMDVQKSTNSAVAAARQAIGSEGISGVSLPTLSNYSASTAGKGSFASNRTLDFNTFTAPLTGELQYNQNRDISNLTDYLKSQEIQKRVLSF